MPDGHDDCGGLAGGVGQDDVAGRAATIVPGRAGKLGVEKGGCSSRGGSREAGRWPYPEGVTSEGGDNGSKLPSSHRDDLDVAYAQLAAEFHSDTANGERRAARDRYTREADRA